MYKIKRFSFQHFIQRLRKITPLKIRILVGPYIGYLVYFFNVYIRGGRNFPNVLSIEETLDLIIKKNFSVIRYGDGEMTLMQNSNLGFQDTDKKLIENLIMILQLNDENLLICVPGIFGRLNQFTKRSFWFAIHHLFRYGHVWRALLSRKQIYGDAHITRPYLGFKDKSRSENIFKKLFFIWEDKDVILIEGEKSRLGVGNDMFDKVKSIQRILCPSENAFSKYEEIKNEATKIDKEKLILVALGPTAKILAYDLFVLGYRVIDIGHIDMEYEMFLRKEGVIIKIPYKYFNEIDERNPKYCDDKEYLKRIIVNIK